MSFELKGAMVSHQFLTEKHGSQATANTLTAALDVIGVHPDLYNKDTTDEIAQHWPIKKFNHSIADLMELEMKDKPGSHVAFRSCASTAPIKNNPVMAKHDE